MSIENFNVFTLVYDGVIDGETVTQRRKIARDFAAIIVNMTMQHISGEQIDKDLTEASIKRMPDGSVRVERIAYGDACVLEMR